MVQPDQPLGVGPVLHPRRAEGRGHAALPHQGAHSAGWSGWSYPFSITIDADLGAGLSAPSLTARATTATEIMLSWTRQCNPNRENDCEPKGVDGYYLEYSEDGVYDREGIRLRSDQTSFVHWGLEPGATLYYRVAGYEEVNVRDLPGRRSPAQSATTGVAAAAAAKTPGGDSLREPCRIRSL